MNNFTEVIDSIKSFFANPLNDEIKSVLEEMAYEHSDTDKYTKMLDNLEKLEKIKNNRKFRLDFDFSGIIKEFIKIGGSLACIFAIKKIEDEIALTGKAPMFIPKFQLRYL